MEIGILIVICAIAFFCEWIDAGLGMGYGTILSPLLIVVGFEPLLVVPSILITQAIGGLSASIFHHRAGNAYFGINSKSLKPLYLLRKIKEHGICNSIKIGLSNDLKVVAIVTVLGVAATMIAAVVAINIPKVVLSTYIGVLVLVMGALIASGIILQYSVKKMLAVGAISAFNKGLSGGGFGPVVTGGQIILGQEHKKAIGCTTAAEPLICIIGFITYLLFKGNLTSWDLPMALGLGAIIGGPIGAITTKKISKTWLKRIIVCLLLTLGTLTLLTTFKVISLKISI